MPLDHASDENAEIRTQSRQVRRLVRYPLRHVLTYPVGEQSSVPLVLSCLAPPARKRRDSNSHTLAGYLGSGQALYH